MAAECPQDFDPEALDPFPDVHSLFVHYNELYFGGQLGACSVEWSSARMTLCAGVCSYQRGGGCRIKLSEPLLKLRPVTDLKETLLHEMIHAYAFLTGIRDDGPDGHGTQFCAKMNAINASRLPDFQRPPGGYNITVRHTMYDEVDNYRQHHWCCERCGELVKRAMNRPPQEADCRSRAGAACADPHCSYHMHIKTCGGTFVKINEPEKKPKAKAGGGGGSRGKAAATAGSAGAGIAAGAAGTSAAGAAGGKRVKPLDRMFGGDGGIGGTSGGGGGKKAKPEPGVAAAPMRGITSFFPTASAAAGSGAAPSRSVGAGSSRVPSGAAADSSAAAPQPGSSGAGPAAPAGSSLRTAAQPASSIAPAIASIAASFSAAREDAGGDDAPEARRRRLLEATLKRLGGSQLDPTPAPHPAAAPSSTAAAALAAAAAPRAAAQPLPRAVSPPLAAAGAPAAAKPSSRAVAPHGAAPAPALAQAPGYTAAVAPPNQRPRNAAEANAAGAAARLRWVFAPGSRDGSDAAAGAGIGGTSAGHSHGSGTGTLAPGSSTTGRRDTIIDLCSSDDESGRPSCRPGVAAAGIRFPGRSQQATVEQLWFKTSPKRPGGGAAGSSAAAAPSAAAGPGSTGNRAAPFSSAGTAPGIAAFPSHAAAAAEQEQKRPGTSGQDWGRPSGSQAIDDGEPGPSVRHAAPGSVVLTCPVCCQQWPDGALDNAGLNAHIDECLRLFV